MKRSNHRFVGALTGHRYWPMRAEPDASIKELVHAMWPRVPAAGLIRVGPDQDGGYLVPDDLDGIVAAISPGVSSEVGFDNWLADQGIDVFMADASVAGPPTDHPNFHFTKRFLGVTNDEQTVRLEDWCEEIAPSTGDMLLQMDIEGAEWPVLLDCPPTLLARFRIMVLELHDVSALFSRLGFSVIAAALHKVLASHHVVHIHPNNDGPIDSFRGFDIPRGMEITLLRRDRAFTGDFATEFPHPLDADCVPTKPTMVLPATWHAPTGAIVRPSNPASDPATNP